MLGWFKKKPQPKQSDHKIVRLKQHFAVAEGSHLQRVCTATVMSVIEHELVVKQRDKLSPESQLIFMMTYECFVMWAIMRGLEAVLKAPDVEQIFLSMCRHFRDHGYYRNGVFEKIWFKMKSIMPMAMEPTPEGVVFPVAEMMMVPSLTGYPIDQSIGADMEFGMFVVWTIGDLERIGRGLPSMSN